MTRAVDPFEEFLRKKKVEMLEEKVRGNPESKPTKKAEPEEAVSDSWAPAEERSEQVADQRLSDEMTDFFERSADAGAELFAQAQELDEDRVDEIKDALEDVFEAEDVGPEVVAEEDDTFIDFFKEVQTSFDPDLADLRREQDLAREIVNAPAEGTFEDEPLTAEFPVPETPVAAEPAMEPEPEMDLQAEPEPELAPAPPPAASSGHPGAPDPLRLEPEHAAALESASLVLDEAVEEDSANSVERLELAEILAPLQEGEDLRARIGVLSRLVVKLVERSELTEGEIIEVLIKSGVGF